MLYENASGIKTVLCSNSSFLTHWLAFNHLMVSLHLPKIRVYRYRRLFYTSCLCSKCMIPSHSGQEWFALVQREYCCFNQHRQSFKSGIAPQFLTAGRWAWIMIAALIWSTYIPFMLRYTDVRIGRQYSLSLLKYLSSY